MKPSATAFTFLLLAGSVAPAADLLKESPFLPPGSSTQSAATGTPLDQLEFSSVTVIGQEIFVSVIDSKSGKGQWLALKTEGKDGLIAESYNAKTDEVMVRLGAQTKVLSLRTATIKVGTVLPPPPAVPMPAVANVIAPGSTEVAASIPPKSPEIERQEREARMLVSDLLEIGMIQRKAYEEKRAAEDAAKKKAEKR